MTRYQRRINQLLESEHETVSWKRTKIIESSTCIPTLVVCRCTRHSLKLIATVYGNQYSVRWRRYPSSPSLPRTLTREEKAITEILG